LADQRNTPEASWIYYTWCGFFAGYFGCMELFVQNTKTSSDTTTATALWYQSKERSEQKQRLDKRVGFSAEGGLDLIANRKGAILGC